MTSKMQSELRQVTGRIYHTESFGAVDGPGIRFVIFLQGCPLRCLYCHNPDAIPASGGICRTAGQMVDEAMRYIGFIKKGGITFSGGEPLMQPDFVRASALLFKDEGLNTAIDTSGCMAPTVPAIRAAIDSADMLLLDVKAADNETAVKLTGRDLVNTFATLDYCESTGKTVWVRHVLVAGYTLAPEHTEQLARRLEHYRCIERVELLPFHKLGEPKWDKVDMDYQLTDTPPTNERQIENARQLLTAYGLRVQ